MDEIQEMLEHYRITKLVNEYCHGCDRGDELRMAGVYAEDSWDDHGQAKMDGKRFAKQVMEGRRKRGDVMTHLIGQTQTKVNGDTAGAETYFLATIAAKEADGTDHVHQLAGRYVDDLVREEGQWRIKRRLTVRDWSISHKVTDDMMVKLDFIQGQTSQADPSFAALGVTHSGALVAEPAE